MSLACRRRYRTERPPHEPSAVELRRGVRRAPRYRDDQRRRPGHRAGGARPRPVGCAVVGAAARRCAAGDCGGSRRVLSRRSGVGHHGQLSGLVRRFRGPRNRPRRGGRAAAPQCGVGPNGVCRGWRCGDGWPHRSAPTARRSPTDPNIAAGTASPSRSWPNGTGRGWKCWPTPGPTCWRWKRSPISMRPRRWWGWCGSSVCRRGSATPSTGRKPAPGSRWPTRSRWPPGCRRSSRSA